jgi:hypothetical protein
MSHWKVSQRRRATKRINAHSYAQLEGRLSHVAMRCRAGTRKVSNVVDA